MEDTANITLSFFIKFERCSYERWDVPDERCSHYDVESMVSLNYLARTLFDYIRGLRDDVADSCGLAPPNLRTGKASIYQRSCASRKNCVVAILLS